jgi:hypothetical protein
MAVRQLSTTSDEDSVIHRAPLRTLSVRFLLTLNGCADLAGRRAAPLLHPEMASESLQIELRGNLAGMLGATVQTKRSSESDDLSLQVSLVNPPAVHRSEPS